MCYEDTREELRQLTVSCNVTKTKDINNILTKAYNKNVIDTPAKIMSGTNKHNIPTAIKDVYCAMFFMLEHASTDDLIRELMVTNNKDEAALLELELRHRRTCSHHIDSFYYHQNVITNLSVSVVIANLIEQNKNYRENLDYISYIYTGFERIQPIKSFMSIAERLLV